MTKPITGQYEFLHRSGVGLDYFTSRIDRLTLLPNGRFTLIIQESSRVSNAAKSLITVSKWRRTHRRRGGKGRIVRKGMRSPSCFDDGSQEQGQAAWNGEGMQFGPNFFNKVSDSTLLPPTHRLKKDMDDIAKGLKIAGAIGSMAAKAVKTVQDTIQTTQGAGTSATSQPVPTQNAPAPRRTHNQCHNNPLHPEQHPLNPLRQYITHLLSNKQQRLLHKEHRKRSSVTNVEHACDRENVSAIVVVRNCHKLWFTGSDLSSNIHRRR